MTSSRSLSQVKYGAILSYLLIILNTVYGFVISPYLLNVLGESSFGVYKTIGSFSATLLVLDLGIGATVMRYTAKFRAEGKNEDIGNFAAIGLIEASIMCVILLLCSVGCYHFIDDLYSESFTPSELKLSKTLFILTVVNMIFTLIDNVVTGVVGGCNCFVFTNGFKVSMLLLRIILLIVILKFWPNALVLILISILMSLLSVIAHCLYINKKIGIKIKLIRWDKGLFKESLGYTGFIFLQTIAAQANGNLDNMAIGAIIGSSAVAVYSFGLQLYNMFEMLATSFSNLMLPTVSQKIADGATDAELQDVVTKVGRLQFTLLCGALGGYVVLGKEFIQLWLGRGFEDVFYLSLIMMVPVVLTLVQNVNLSILRAKNLMGFRTFQLFFSAIFNAVITIIGTKMYGYYAAAIGTGLSVLLFSVVMMNIYYHKKIGFKVLRFYSNIFHGIFVCALCTSLILYGINYVLGESWLLFITKIIIYIIVFAVLLLCFGLNDSEIEMLFTKFKKR